MKDAGVDRPQGDADRSGAPGGGQARLAAGMPQIIGIAALAGWSLLAASGGGIDPGDGLGGDGPTGAFLALAIGAPLAAVAVVLAWDRAALRSGPARLALAAAGGIALWSGLSIVWAAAPDLAWIDANRQAIALAALALGLSLGALLPRAPVALGLGLSAAAALPVAIALGSKIVPGLLGSDRDLARLAEPVGYWNALALVTAMALPGLLWLAGDRRRWALPLAGAAIAAYGVALVLTYSRGGLLAAAMAVAVTVALIPRRGPALAALVAGAAGAAWPAAQGLTDDLLSSDAIPVDLREGAGAGFGWRLAAGLALAAVLAPAIVWAWGRLGLGARGRPRLIAVGLVVALCLIVVAGTAASPQGRDWADERVSELRGEGGDAVANDPGRLVSASANQRRAWWGEAWRGFEDSPLLGQGAGGFALVHLQERRNSDDALATREPHGVGPRFLSGTGLVGTALFAALVGAIVWGVLRAARIGVGPEIGLPLAVLAAFALQASIDWAWAIPALTVPALAAAGVVLAAAAPGRATGAATRPGPLAAGALACVAALAVASAALPWWSARAAAQGEDALARRDAQAALARAGDARAANPLALAPLLLRGAAFTDLGQAARALGAYRKATEVQPDNPAAWRTLARFLGDGPEAREAWARVRALDPQDPEAALRAGALGAPG
ncbi:MAG TPA: O-antigen ligase family protein [Miltoncostaeaceae bacterium]|nr:O-antigen ligase family protein [Miltoncostaeaceae bacterium]